MSGIFDDIAKILIYKGEPIENIIEEAIIQGKEYKIEHQKNGTRINVSFKTAYDIIINDIFIYNCDNELIKQQVSVKGKLRTVFDKYEEAQCLLSSLEYNQIIA
ncbi:hypothetical protein ACSYG7_14550 [Bacillus velezensis]|nr:MULTISPECIES: hypothetical protein [Bacillus amyloliquefaciens group]AWM45152.1 hypothetical protein BAALB65_14315 [Bacillus amyloliquefaciens]MCE4939120.1 hypothetical protein [Bacillus velezensis]MDH3074812.1 hypothetical protein [Bacillus velezensis]MDH3085763.1 hypothetical protein [Bacillus velezensis]MDH3106448.1 hypothetical protein [Bacillus velezensis]